MADQLDMKYQNQSDSISAHWYGFTDKQSSIVSYTWCVSSEDAQDSCDIVPQTNLGMRRSITYPIDSVENGKLAYLSHELLFYKFLQVSKFGYLQV